MSARDYLTTREVAKRLGVSVSTVQVWVESGVLPAWKTAGGHRRLPLDVVDKLCRTQDVCAAGTMPPFQVLLVEDDPVQRDLFHRNLADWTLPITLLTAQDGMEGLWMMGHHGPDLVIADLAMPGMNGFHMLRRLREMSAAMPEIWVVSGLTSDEIATAGGVPEGIPVYPKPLPFAVLRSLIQQRIELRSEIGRPQS